MGFRFINFIRTDSNAFLFMTVIFHCVYVPQLLYPFICWWTSRLHPCSQFSSVQSLSCARLFVTPWTAACQAPLSFTISQSLLNGLLSTESVMPSNHLILCHPLLFRLSIFSSISLFSNESALCIRWLTYWSFSFSISPSNEYSGLVSFRIDWLDFLAVQGSFRSLKISWHLNELFLWQIFQ